jgi:hypothetical protein
LKLGSGCKGAITPKTHTNKCGTKLGKTKSNFCTSNKIKNFELKLKLHAHDQNLMLALKKLQKNLIFS